jgi:GTPase SAR1 family protein
MENMALALLLQDYNFDEREVRNCVKSAYNSNYSPIFQATPAPETFVPTPDRASRRKAERKQKKDDKAGMPADQTALPDSVNPAQPVVKPEKIKKIQGPQYTFDEVEAYIRTNYETRNNIVSGRLEWRFAHTNTPFEEMDDIVINSLFCDLHHIGQFIPVNTLYLLLNSKFSPPINPFIEYSNSIATWDGVTDYIGQLAATVKTHDDKHWNICLRKWIVAFAAGMIVDNIINHTVIVLIGDQGIGKTTFIRRLLPQALSDYLGTSTMLSDNKDTSIQLSECGLIILDEIESLTKKELAALKEYLTRVNVHIRKPFGRFTVNLVRRASVICSLNREDLLTDTTGSRRFLCFKVSEIDYQHTVDMDGVMAQAFALYKSGFRYWMDKTDISVINKHNERFYAKSVEQEMIETWVRPVTQEEWDNRNKFASDSI